ncbi:hypothetical protein [Sphingobacterium siyangense]|uniref:hypothetical protein n=1 Tax=Sphingobacterium siyangense TaxID=459529 RepID=UPI0030187AB8
MAQKSKNLVNSIDFKNMSLHDTSNNSFEFSAFAILNKKMAIDDIYKISGHKSIRIQQFVITDWKQGRNRLKKLLDF